MILSNSASWSTSSHADEVRPWGADLSQHRSNVRRTFAEREQWELHGAESDKFWTDYSGDLFTLAKQVFRERPRQADTPASGENAPANNQPTSTSASRSRVVSSSDQVKVEHYLFCANLYDLLASLDPRATSTSPNSVQAALNKDRARNIVKIYSDDEQAIQAFLDEVSDKQQRKLNDFTENDIPRLIASCR